MSFSLQIFPTAQIIFPWSLIYSHAVHAAIDKGTLRIFFLVVGQTLPTVQLNFPRSLIYSHALHAHVGGEDALLQGKVVIEGAPPYVLYPEIVRPEVPDLGISAYYMFKKS